MKTALLTAQSAGVSTLVQLLRPTFTSWYWPGCTLPNGVMLNSWSPLPVSVAAKVSCSDTLQSAARPAHSWHACCTDRDLAERRGSKLTMLLPEPHAFADRKLAHPTLPFRICRLKAPVERAVMTHSWRPLPSSCADTDRSAAGQLAKGRMAGLWEAITGLADSTECGKIAPAGKSPGDTGPPHLLHIGQRTGTGSRCRPLWWQ